MPLGNALPGNNFRVSIASAAGAAGAGTVTVAGGAGGATFSTSQAGAGIVAGTTPIRLLGIWYIITTFNGTTGATIANAPNQVASAFYLSGSTVFAPLGLMHDADVSVDEQVNEFEVFDSDDPITFAGKPKRMLTVAGYLGDADSGQLLALAAAAAKTPAVLRFLWDGTNGFIQEVKVTSYKGSPKAGNQPIDLTFDFRATSAVGSIVGVGPLL